MLDYFEPGRVLSWRGPSGSFTYRIFTNEQEELLLKRKGFGPTPLEQVDISPQGRMGIISHGRKPRICRNILCLDPETFPIGLATTAPDFSAGSLRPLYVMGVAKRTVKGLGKREVLSVVLGDEEEVGYEFDLRTGLLVWTNNWQVEPGQTQTCEVELDQVDLPFAHLEICSRPLQFKQDPPLPKEAARNPIDLGHGIKERLKQQEQTDERGGISVSNRGEPGGPGQVIPKPKPDAPPIRPTRKSSPTISFSKRPDTSMAPAPPDTGSIPRLNLGERTDIPAGSPPAPPRPVRDDSLEIASKLIDVLAENPSSGGLFRKRG